MICVMWRPMVIMIILGAAGAANTTSKQALFKVTNDAVLKQNYSDTAEQVLDGKCQYDTKYLNTCNKLNKMYYF